MIKETILFSPKLHCPSNPFLLSASQPVVGVPNKLICPGVLGPLASDVASLTLLSRALMSREMHELDLKTVPVPFREEVKHRIGYVM